MDGIPMYCHTYLFVQYIYFVIRHWEVTVPFFTEHLFNTTTYGVCHTY